MKAGTTFTGVGKTLLSAGITAEDALKTLRLTHPTHHICIPFPKTAGKTEKRSTQTEKTAGKTEKRDTNTEKRDG